MVDEKIMEVIAETLLVDLFAVTPGANLVDDLNADSLDMVELAMTIEEKFDLEIPDHKVEKWQTVADVIACVSAETLFQVKPIPGA